MVVVAYWLEGKTNMPNVSHVTFKEVRSPASKSREVAMQLLSAINTGVYRSGEKLPPERLLAEQMKVSRTCVREALSALSVLGIVGRKVGYGTYVLASKSEIAEFPRPFALNQSRDDLLDIWEARMEIEAVIVKVCIESATPKAIGRIERYLGQMKEMVQSGASLEYLNLDKKFHFSIARGTNNPILENTIRPLIGITNNYLLEKVSVDHLQERCLESLPEHASILEAIKKRDIATAVDAIRDHFANVERYFGRRFW
jgi:DNA-binding FadR family transcriptional regulator